MGGLTSAIVTVLDTANDSVVGEVNLGDEGANSGDGYEPTGMVLVSTPTPGAGSAAPARPSSANADKSRS